MMKDISSYIGTHYLWKYEKHPLAIVFIDGGFTSQMIRASFGKVLEDKGFDVRYERSFYERSGYDMCRQDRREYLLDKCFPDVSIPEPENKTLKRYRKYYDYESGRYGKIDDVEAMDIRKPIYFSGYSSDDLIKEEDCVRYFSLDHIGEILGNKAGNYLSIIHENNRSGILNVGIHVRRGDMAQTGYYWKVLTGEYFIEAVRHIKEKYKGQKLCFFFFSNGFDFVKSDILPGIEEESVVLVNDCDAEYEDFYLLSKCDIQVESQGSWGRIAYLFNENPDKLLVTYKTDMIKEHRVLQISLTPEMINNG